MDGKKEMEGAPLLPFTELTSTNWNEWGGLRKN
jgi:hypothetical protein